MTYFYNSKDYKYATKSIDPIARKYELDRKILLEAFIQAWLNKTSNCRNLTIVCRYTDNDCANFLITEDEEVVSQFPIKLEDFV